MLSRTLLLIGVAWILITGIILSSLVIQSWQEMRRHGLVSSHIEYQKELDAVADAMAERFLPQADAGPGERRFLAENAAVLHRLAADERALVSGTTARVRHAAAALEAADSLRIAEDEMAGVLVRALTGVREALVMEFSANEALLKELADYGERQLLVAVILALLVPVAMSVFLVFFRRRVFAPLDDLGRLIGLLSRKDYSAAMTDDVDPLLAPLFEQYNRMVKRMRDLDAGHVKREDGLQKDVQQATRALFQQQAALARAERMAAVGDMSARLAHDLRNPLSGVLMALSNLRSEVDSTEQGERLGLAIEELERITRLLNNLVDESRLVPERPQRLQVSQFIGDLGKLLCYQLGDNIELAVRVPPNLYCSLPETEFRHVVLNLVLNAEQAIDQRPGKIVIGAAMEDGRLRLAIGDNGPGFPPELLKTGIHEHGTWRKKGAGLGLAAVRRFVLAHSGSLELSNSQQGGAEVVLTLPLDDSRD